MHIVSHRGSSLSSPRHPIHACAPVRCVVVVLFTRLLFLFVPLLFFRPFQMSSSEFHERLKSKDLRNFRLGTVATSDHETPLTFESDPCMREDNLAMPAVPRVPPLRTRRLHPPIWTVMAPRCGITMLEQGRIIASWWRCRLNLRRELPRIQRLSCSSKRRGSFSWRGGRWARGGMSMPRFAPCVGRCHLNISTGLGRRGKWVRIYVKATQTCHEFGQHSTHMESKPPEFYANATLSCPT